jgi:hypothetical protein
VIAVIAVLSSAPPLVSRRLGRRRIGIELSIKYEISPLSGSHDLPLVEASVYETLTRR